MTLRRSALYPVAVAAGGETWERYGWELPAAYAGVASECQAATESTAVHDVSYMGRLRATGADVLDLLNRLSTNKVVDLQPGQGAPTILTTDRGRILDLISVVNTGDHILLITSPGTQPTVIAWLDRYTILEDLAVEDITATTAMLAVCGPGSRAALETAAGIGLGHLPLHHSALAEVAGHQARIIRHHLAELPGFYLVISPEAAPQVWQRTIDSGATPMGTAAYEAVRVRFGIPVHGSELGEEYNPLEAGLIGSIDFAKGCYIGQEVIARLGTYQKVQKHLARLTLSPGCAASPGAPLLHNGRMVGKVTSAAGIPLGGEMLGLGYVRTGSAAAGTRLEVGTPAEGWAEVQDLPQLFGPGAG